MAIANFRVTAWYSSGGTKKDHVKVMRIVNDIVDI
jgi:hypothetical protein